LKRSRPADLTYRIFDWNRVDADGRPRTLQVQKAGRRAPTSAPARVRR